MLLLLLLGLVIASLAACSSQIRDGAFDSEVARSDKHKIILGFDLRNDSYPTAGIVLHIQSSLGMTTEQRTIVLPFPSSAAGRSRPLLTTWGSYEDCCTLISYTRTSATVGEYVIPLAPAFATQPDVVDILAMPGRLYLLRLNQERRFVYKYGDRPENVAFRQLVSTAFADTPEAIAVAIPTGAEGREIREGKTSIPSHISSNSLARFYPATAASAGSDHLEIRYVLPLTRWQEPVLKILAKLLAAIAPPFLGLAFLKVGEVRKDRIRRTTLAIGLILQLGILVSFFAIAWPVRSMKSFDQLAEPLIVVVGGIFASVLLWLQSGVKS